MRSVRTRPAALRARPRPLVLLLLLVLLAGCGEPSAEYYCEQLREDREEIADILASEDPGALQGENLRLLEDLGEQAPRDLREEWSLLLDALQGLEQALDDADLTAEDFEDGEPPPSADEDDLASLEVAVSRVQAPDVVAAAQGIETQARDVCRVNLGL